MCSSPVLVLAGQDSVLVHPTKEIPIQPSVRLESWAPDIIGWGAHHAYQCSSPGVGSGEGSLMVLGGLGGPGFCLIPGCACDLLQPLLALGLPLLLSNLVLHKMRAWSQGRLAHIPDWVWQPELLPHPWQCWQPPAASSCSRPPSSQQPRPAQVESLVTGETSSYS